ncbi:MAG TPA: DUF1634 domain-containing protein [Terracidiphilus sp.]|jgi:uncharacterized membrane protein|nr:DUF1634 domain-containing protein [Terracidiphilus sp.]
MDDRRLEVLIGNLLRAGVLLAAAVVFAGGVFYLAQNHAAKVDFHTFAEESANLRTVGGIVYSAVQLRSSGLMQLGLLLLIATPVARVIFAVVGFHLEGDRMYTIVSLIVLAVLTISLLHAT